MADPVDSGAAADSDEIAMVCRRFRVTGRVQGVFFRASTQTVARDLGLGGHAVNCADGSVEVLASGPERAVEKLRHWLRLGPTMANVETLSFEDEPYFQVDDFTTD